MFCEDCCTCGKTEKTKIDATCPEPYRRGIGQGFGSTEDGQ